MELTNLDILIRLAIALGLGLLIGVERTLAGKNAGMRTYALASMGSAMFAMIALMIGSGSSYYNPAIMTAAIISGIGFIGAGLVFHNEKKVSGLTSAAGLWVSAGVGMACGFNLFTLAVIASGLTLVIFTVLWFVEKIVKKASYSNEERE